MDSRTKRPPRVFAAHAAVLLVLASACHDATTAPPTPTATNECSVSGTLTLSVNQAARVDCSNGGTTVTLAGNGASYLVVPQFAISLVPNSPTSFRLTSSGAVSTTVASIAPSPSEIASFAEQANGMPHRPLTLQRGFDRRLRQRAASLVASGAWSAEAAVAPPLRSEFAAASVPAVGSARSFRVLANVTGTAFSTVTARLAFSGANILVYVDTLAPAGGFSASQLQAFGTLFDQTLYPIDTAAFGPPSDVDGNGRVIMLMSPAVNALTKSSDCGTNGFVEGFFDEEDLGGSAADSNSNHGEIFYSIVPDPAGTVSCAHNAAEVGLTVPATFLHELQHLISFSQHFVVHHGSPEYGWLDEGMSIVAEELGSLHYEQVCPGTACRSNPAQIFPDSSQGFIQGFLFDSYSYGLEPDTASVTLHTDSDGGFSWRGGDWLLMHWLGDQMPAGFYRRLEQNTLTGVANIENVSGQSFPALFANFGLALVTDSLPGLPRTTAPASNRFVTRNMRFLWARLSAASPGTFPRAFPLQLQRISADSTARTMVPGTGFYFRLDTQSGAPTATIQFATPANSALPASLRPQLSVYRLPPGQ